MVRLVIDQSELVRNLEGQGEKFDKRGRRMGGRVAGGELGATEEDCHLFRELSVLLPVLLSFWDVFGAHLKHLEYYLL